MLVRGGARAATDEGNRCNGHGGRDHAHAGREQLNGRGHVQYAEAPFPHPLAVLGRRVSCEGDHGARPHGEGRAAGSALVYLPRTCLEQHERTKEANLKSGLELAARSD